MSTIKAAIRLYGRLIRKLSSGRFYSSEEFMNEFDISKRTLERYFTNLREEFSVNVKFDRSRSGYYIEHPNETDLDNLLYLLDLVEQAEVLTAGIQADNKLIEAVDFSRNERLSGIHWLQPIFGALREKTVLQISYHRFGADEAETVEIKPVLLKQYEDRWYVIALVDSKKDIRIYALDRIKGIQALAENFTVEKGFDVKSFFKHTVGINFSNNKPERVVLRFDFDQANYVRSLPIHHSQKTMETTKAFETIELKVVINHELKQRILMFAGTVEVLEPTSLRTWMRETLEKGRVRNE